MSDRAGRAPSPSGTIPSTAETRIRLSAATMARATAFVVAGLRSAAADGGPPVPRVIANSLRELDRFLSLLIDEVALASRPAGLDRVDFARQSNTPNKLRQVHAALGLASPDHERLRAIGRGRDRLFHSSPPCGGAVVPLPGWLRAGGIGGDRAGQARAVTIAVELRRICRLYDRIAAELVAAGEAQARAAAWAPERAADPRDRRP